MGPRVLRNPHGREEVARTIGLQAATAELVLLLDADDELPSTRWLSRTVSALSLGDDIVAADSLFHEWRRERPRDREAVRAHGRQRSACRRAGMGRRWAWHLGRWTGMPVPDIEEHRDAIVVRIDSRPASTDGLQRLPGPAGSVVADRLPTGLHPLRLRR